MLGLKREGIPEDVMGVIARLAERGYQGYLVGGAVRDLLLRKKPKDWDVATDAEPYTVEEIFPGSILTGKRFGTITVKTEHHMIEVTTFRKDGPYIDGRRPEWVSYSSRIDDDLRRRDFTVNAIAWDPLAGRIIDPTGGQSDLRRRLLRAIGDPTARFQEDALRMIRFYRFQSTLEFKGERRTERAVEPSLIRGVSGERIRDEMNRLLVSASPSRGLKGLLRSGLLQEFSPEVAAMHRVKQGKMHQFDVMGHAMEATEAIRPELELRWAALLHDIGKPITQFEDESGIHFYGHEQIGAEITETVLKRLAYPKSFIMSVATLVRYHMFYYGPEMTDAGLRRLAARVGSRYIPALLELRRADIVATNNRFDQAWLSYSECRDRLKALIEDEAVFTMKDLAIRGRDLESLGWTPGPVYREALEQALQWVLEDPKRNKKDVLLAYVETLKLNPSHD